MMKTWLVYIHKNQKTEEVFYVGIGSTIKRPYAKSNRSDRWQNYVRKYGLPIIEIIHSGLSFDNAMLIEKELIAKYGRKKYEPNGQLINVSKGGYGSEGVPCSEERKEYLRTMTRGENNPNYGRKHTDEAREKIRQSRIGKSLSDTTKLKIWQSLKSKGYNIGFKHTDETKERMMLKRLGKSATEETKQKMRNSIATRGGPWMKGRKHSEESKQRVSEANKGRLTGALNPKSKMVIDMSTGISYASCKEACGTLNLNYTYVKSQLNGFHKNHTTLKYL